MAEVDFGDSELFQQFEEDIPSQTHIRFTDDEDVPAEIRDLRDKLEECEETIRRLKAENQELKRKLNVLSRPSSLHVEDSRFDGPLLQILFANNDISKQCRQEIEDCILSLIHKHEHQEKNGKESSSHVKPQASSFVLEENHKIKTSSTIKKIKDAFSVVGSVLYFTSFCLDKLGQPLLNDNPQLTEGWEIPKYQQVFGQVISTDGQEVQIKEKRPKACCFNCGSEDHQLKDCPKPRDMARISEKRKEFSQGNNQSNQRYHAEEVEERFGKYRPGTVSDELLDALGVAQNSLPPFIYCMRQLGYPPGWLKEAEMENSGLTLYDGRVSSDGEMAEDENYQSHKISYDVSKLVDFPGFNVCAPSNIKDEWRSYGSVPMQANHMKQNFAAYLSNNFPMPGSNCNKRPYELDATPRHSKKRRSDVDSVRCSDMEVDSGPETPCSSRSSDTFQFQPPLPLGSPTLGTPPPLPRGTPPATPTPPPLPKGTPPATPSHSSPALRGRGSGEETGEEDGLTLEELEEQQRLIWAALENADTATNSDSEIPAAETPVISSSGASTPAQMDKEAEVEEGADKLEELSSSSEDHHRMAIVEEGLVADDKEDNSHDIEEIKDELVPETDATMEIEVIPPTPTENSETKEPSEEAGKGMTVPHRSKFAEGIIPFEDTPEYKDVAEATGVYLKIRDLLKSSPRNQTKKKK